MPREEQGYRKISRILRALDRSHAMQIPVVQALTIIKIAEFKSRLSSHLPNMVAICNNMS